MYQCVTVSQAFNSKKSNAYVGAPGLVCAVPLSDAEWDTGALSPLDSNHSNYSYPHLSVIVAPIQKGSIPSIQSVHSDVHYVF